MQVAKVSTAKDANFLQLSASSSELCSLSLVRSKNCANEVLLVYQLFLILVSIPVPVVRFVPQWVFVALCPKSALLLRVPHRTMNLLDEICCTQLYPPTLFDIHFLVGLAIELFRRRTL